MNIPMQRRESGLFVPYPSRPDKSPKPRPRVKASTFLEVLDDEGNVVEEYSAPNTITSAGFGLIAGTLASTSYFGGGQLRLDLAAGSSTAAASAKQVSGTPDHPSVQGSYFAARGLFVKSGTAITGINNVLVRLAASPNTIIAHSALSSLTRTTTHGTNPFTSNATKPTTQAWRITWRLSIALSGASGLTTSEQTALRTWLMQAVGLNDQYIGEARSKPLLEATFDPQGSGLGWRPDEGDTVSQVSVSGSTATVAVSVPGPTPPMSARRTARVGIYLGTYPDGGSRTVARWLYRHPSGTTVNFGPSVAGGTFEVDIAFS